MNEHVEITGYDVVTSAGKGVPFLAELILSKSRELDRKDTPWIGSEGHPYTGGFLEESDLPPLNRKTYDLDPESLATRLIKLGALGLQGLETRIEKETKPLPLILGLPFCDQLHVVSEKIFLDNLMRQAQIPIDIQASHIVFTPAEDAGIAAIRLAYEKVIENNDIVIVGGIDSYCHFSRLIDFDFEYRRRCISFDNAPPLGEAAGFLILRKVRDPDSHEPLLQIMSDIEADQCIEKDLMPTYIVGAIRSYRTYNYAMCAQRTKSLFRDKILFNSKNQIFRVALLTGDTGIAMASTMLGLATYLMKEIGMEPATLFGSLTTNSFDLLHLSAHKGV